MPPQPDIEHSATTAKKAFGLRCNCTLRQRILLTMLLVIASLVILLTALQISAQKTFLNEALYNHNDLERSHFNTWSEGIASTLSGQVENSLASYNFSLLTLLLQEAISGEDNFIFAIVIDSDGKPVFTSGNKEVATLALANHILAAAKPTELTKELYVQGEYHHLLQRTTIIQFSSTPWGELRLGFSLDGLDAKMVQAQDRINIQVREMIIRSVLVACLFVLLSTLLAAIISSKITKRLAKLTDIAHELSRGNFQASSVLSPSSSQDEVGVLGDAFIEMSVGLQKSHERIEEYSHSLEQQVDERTRELSAAYHELKESQNQLIQAEKMASLGQLVGGVAHEINTPIGIGVTAATHMEEATQHLAADFANQTMTKASLENYLAKSGEAVHLVLSNLQRTSELVANFKQVSVDQASHEQRLFNLKEYIDSIIVSLGPRLRKSPVQVEVECADDILVNSYPGAFAQVLTNLIINSLLHAFGVGEDGVITISARQKSQQATVIYHDDGQGISPDHIDQVFDPFFTTKRGEGGSGLGLHIVYNIMTQTMGGTIFCESAEGEGTTFILSFPLDVA